MTVLQVHIHLFQYQNQILFSKNPIAIDKASMDLVIERNGGVDPFRSHNKNSNYILKYGEEIGLGNIKYELEMVK